MLQCMPQGDRPRWHRFGRVHRGIWGSGGWLGVAAMVLLLAAPAARAEAVRISEAGSGGFEIVTDTYTAAVAADGSLTSLAANGVEFLGVKRHRGEVQPGTQGLAFPGKSAERLSRHGRVIAARRGDVRVEYTFNETSIDVLTQGAKVALHLTQEVSTFVRKDGRGLPGTTRAKRTSSSGVTTLAVGKVGLRFDQPLHVHGVRGAYVRAVPSVFVHQKDLSKPVEFSMEVGVTVDLSRLLQDPELTAAGYATHEVPMFKGGEPTRLALTTKNLGAEPITGKVTYQVLDHYTDAEVVHDGASSLEVAPGQAAEVPLALNPPSPGVYWCQATILVDGKVMARAKRGFVYEPDQVTHPLTRPDDFDAFWDSQLESLRAIPFDATATESAERSGKGYTWYDVTLKGIDGEPLDTFLTVPKSAGPHVARLQGMMPGDSLKQLASRFQSKSTDRRTRYVWLGVPMPEAATYRRWESREDNNMLACYLWQLRMCDYLRTRDEVSEIFLFGASRGGPIAIATAALAPEKVAAVVAHVPTSAGISWEDKPYTGWGAPPQNMREVAAYFDPVNFAPDVTVPLIVDAGINDDLAPLPGILALYNMASESPFRRISIQRAGHAGIQHGYRNTYIKQLNQWRGSDLSADPDKAIMEQH